MIIAIIGPTGVGKTKLSIELAKHYQAEIINADSVQVYKELNIGSAKIKEDEKEGIVHHLLDVVSIKDDYSVFDYQKDARLVLDRLIKENKNVVIVGGTGLYLKALLYDYQFKEEPKYDFSKLSTDEILRKLNQYEDSLDIHPNNRQRLERRLAKHLNKSIDERISPKLYDFKLICLTKDREELYEDINQRVDTLLEEGLFDEVKSLYEKYPNSRILNTAIGYKELVSYLKKEIDYQTSIKKIKQNSRNYAKRQMTFFKRQLEANYFDLTKVSIDEIIKFLGD